MLRTLLLLPMLRIDAKLPMLKSDAALATDNTLEALEDAPNTPVAAHAFSECKSRDIRLHCLTRCPESAVCTVIGRVKVIRAEAQLSL